MVDPVNLDDIPTVPFEPGEESIVDEDMNGKNNEKLDKEPVIGNLTKADIPDSIEINARSWGASLISRHKAQLVKRHLEEHNFTYWYNTDMALNGSAWDILGEISRLGDLVMHDNFSGFLLGDQYLLRYNITSRANKYKILDYEIMSESESVERKLETYLNQLLEDFKFQADVMTLTWYYLQSNGRESYSRRIEILDDDVYDEAYPNIEDLDDYINDYLERDERIMIMKGVPGTGKTRLIRYIVQQFADEQDISNVKVLFSNESELLQRDKLFIEFIDGNYDFLILEDMDEELRPRDEGNRMMNKLLNASDGIVTQLDGKVIMSTNLESINKFDSALTRPGRCYDVLEFPKLDQEEASLLMDKLTDGDFDRDLDDDEYTLAEVYELASYKETGDRYDNPADREVGF